MHVPAHDVQTAIRTTLDSQASVNRPAGACGADGALHHRPNTPLTCEDTFSWRAAPVRLSLSGARSRFL